MCIQVYIQLYRGSCFLNTTTYDSVVKELELALYIVQILASICSSSTCQAADYACIKDQRCMGGKRPYFQEIWPAVSRPAEHCIRRSMPDC